MRPLHSGGTRTASDAARTVLAMLRLIDPDEHPPDAAYRIPWWVDRSDPPWCRVVNVGPDMLSHVSTQFFGEGWMEPAIPRASVAPGESLRIALWGPHAVDSARITVHWRVRSGEESEGEYAWTFVM